MMKKQKIMLYRIIAAAVIYVPLFVLEHMGKLEFQSEIPDLSRFTVQMANMSLFSTERFTTIRKSVKN